MTEQKRELRPNGVTEIPELGLPVLLDGEDRASYDRLLAQVIEAVEPADIIEQFWIRDIVELFWEASRLRRLKANLLKANVSAGLKKVLEPLVDFMQLGRLIERWYARDKSAVKLVNKLMKQAGLTMDAVLAQTLSTKLDEIERIDRMIASAEARRHVVLREMDRRRAAVAARLRAEMERIEDAEFDDVPAPQLGTSAAA